MNKLAQVNIGQEFFGGSSKFTDLTAIGSLITLFLNIAFVIASIVLLFFFLQGGISILGYAGQDDPQKIANAQKAVFSSLIGFIIVAAAYFLVQLILQLFGLHTVPIFQSLFNF